jgi:hypothetical protein
MSQRSRPVPLDLEYALRYAREFSELGELDHHSTLDERTLAETIRSIVTANEHLPPWDREFLEALADALDDAAANWKLRLSRQAPGRWEPLTQKIRRDHRDVWIAIAVEYLVQNKGWKTEAAVAFLSERNNWSRASIFDALKRVRESPGFRRGPILPLNAKPDRSPAKP